MKETVSLAQAATASEAVLPVRVQEALGELVGAAMEGLLALSVEAERQFRRIIGYRDLAKLAVAIEHELHRHPIREVAVTLA